MDTLSQHYDAAIVGGGMVGLSLALALGRLGLKLALVERGSLPAQLDAAFDGRVSAIALGSQRMLARLGAWNGMAPHAEAIQDIRVSDGDSPFFLHYDHAEIGREPFGYIVENRYIRHALQTALAACPAVTLYEGTDVAGHAADSTGASLRLSDGSELRARLLVGADGKRSRLRQLAGIGAHEKQYRQTAIVATIRHDRPHRGLAQERFLSAGPFAVLPMTDSRSSLVWVEPEDRAPVYLALSPQEFTHEIQLRTGGYLGALQPAGERFSYPLSMMHAKDYVATRLALIGDAAHAIHPIAGQGVNLGFRDVAVLTELVERRFRLGLDIAGEDVLAGYQRWRRFDNVTMTGVTDMLNSLFASNLPPARLARRLGLETVGKLPPLKHFFMKHAMGLVGDLPPLLRAL